MEKLEPQIYGMTLKEQADWCKAWDETRTRILSALGDREIWLCAYNEEGEKKGGKPNGMGNQQ